MDGQRQKLDIVWITLRDSLASLRQGPRIRRAMNGGHEQRGRGKQQKVNRQPLLPG